MVVVMVGKKIDQYSGIDLVDWRGVQTIADSVATKANHEATDKTGLKLGE